MVELLTRGIVTRTLAAFAIVGAFAWGMWQLWFMCAVALLPIYLRVAAAVANLGETVPRATA